MDIPSIKKKFPMPSKASHITTAPEEARESDDDCSKIKVLQFFTGSGKTKANGDPSGAPSGAPLPWQHHVQDVQAQQKVETVFPAGGKYVN